MAVGPVSEMDASAARYEALIRISNSIRARKEPRDLFGILVDELRKVAPLVRNVHLKDNRGGFEDWYFPAVGDGGSVDFTRVRQVLDGVGFLGPYTIEIEGIGGEPEPGLDARQERIARSVRHLRDCGYVDA